MARVYQITEEEMQSLIDSLQLEKFNDQTLVHPDKFTVSDMHRKFHYHVVRWAQAMGFTGHR